MVQLSVNVACYNVEKHIAQCLDSLIHQTFLDIEINCIDNGSTDRTLEIIEELSAKHPIINVHRNLSNVGLSGSRKNGLLVSKAKYTMMIDGDDWLAPNACQVLYEAITKADVDVVECDCYVVDEDGMWIDRDKSYCRFTQGEVKGSDIFAALLNNEIAQMTWNKIYRTDLAKEAYLYYTGEGFFHKEDVLFTNIFYHLCDSYLGIPDKLYNYRKGSGGSHNIDYLGRLRNSEICFAITNAYYNSGSLGDIETNLVKKKVVKWMNEASPERIGQLPDEMGMDRYLSGFIGAWGGLPLQHLLKSSDPYALEIGRTWLNEFLNCIEKVDHLDHFDVRLDELLNIIGESPAFASAQQRLEQLKNIEALT